MADGHEVEGRLEQIWIYPVRSLAGTALERAEAGLSGLAGDRVATVVGEDGRPVRGKDAPAMRSVRPTGDAVADGAALTAALGRPVQVQDAPPDDAVAPVHLVSAQALARAAAGEVPEGCSPDDPRANLVLDLADGADERSWVGRQVRIGDAVLEITRTPRHCLGVYADVRQAGGLAVGDAVLL
ncbi:MAG: MOSC N-terminal beta barrel domain-containing protein [Blastococcus sp.]